MMCESMCVGSLKMTFVPEPAVQPKPRERIKPRAGLASFKPGDRVFNVGSMNGAVAVVYNTDPYIVIRDRSDCNWYIESKGHFTHTLHSGYNCPFVLESETIIENGKRVVGYVNDPCPAPKPKTMKFNDLPNFSVFTSDKDWGSNMNYQFIKISRDLVMYSWKCGSAGYRMSSFCRLEFPNDPSWGIWNNSANCTVIGSVQFG